MVETERCRRGVANSRAETADVVGPGRWRGLSRRLRQGLTGTTLLAVLALAACAQAPLKPDDPRQAGLLQRSIGELSPQRPGVTDVYLVGAAL